MFVGTQLKESEMKVVTGCRICGTETVPYFDYGLIPLVNQLFETQEAALNASRYPLELYRCPECVNSQLSAVVDPMILYKDYPYQSSISKPFLAHCAALARKIDHTMNLKHGDVTIDIGGNDGVFTRELTAISAYLRSYVIDPSQESSSSKTFSTISAFWNLETAKNFKTKARLVTAQNVVAHVHDVHDFFEGISHVLADDGIFVVEVPHVLRMLQRCEFDTVYHEHLSYMSVIAFEYLAARHGLRVFDVEFLDDVHCGTIRVWMRRGGGNVLLAESERLLYDPDLYERYQAMVAARISMTREAIASSKGLVVGITASAKGNVFLNMLGESDIAYLVDDAPTKIGRFAPGVGLEIKSFSRENIEGAGMAVILARNFKDALIEKLKGMNFTGEVYVP